MIAFLGDPTLKSDMLAEIAAHRERDQIVKGTYGEGNNGDWRGCAVGCSLHSLNKRRGTSYSTGDHEAFEPGLGIPRQLAYLQDYLFENLPNPKHIAWPERFMSAIRPGADLTLVTPRFVCWLLTDALPLVNDEHLRSIYATIIGLYERWIAGDRPSDTEWSEAAARAALADLADRADLADLAARAALADLADRADLADLAARAALAWHERVEQQADKLIELLEAA